MNAQELIQYLIDHAEETYGENEDVVHYVGVMPLSFHDFEGFTTIENEGYIDEISSEGIHYDFHEY